jgi:hypothetical protein
MDQTKKTLVCHNGTTIASSPWIKNKLACDFDIENYDATAEYNPMEHVMIINRYEYDQVEWIEKQFEQRGFKTIKEYFWDNFENQPPITQGQELHIRAKDWCWIHSHLMNQYRNYNYQPNQSLSPSKFFLLLMNMKRDTRDWLFDQVGPYLDDSLYSYRGRDIRIANDDPNADGSTVTQTYSNTAWYTTTNFSLVAETLPWTGQERVFVSEKTFKPIELSHPFIIYGNQGTLPYLHGLGFETFGHIIDESYDLEPNLKARLASIDTVLKSLYREFKQGKILFGDAESQRRIQHNYNRFHDTQAVNKLWQTQVVDVIQEFIHV